LVLEVRDQDGNLKDYKQSDNVITNTGENCVSKAIFRPSLYRTGTTNAVCTGAITQPFAYIALGIGTTAEAPTDNNMETQTSATGLGIALGSITFTNSTGAGSGTNGAAKVVIARTFTNTSGGTVNIAEAGLFNDTASSTNGMFAHKVFTPIAVANNDQLTVTWTINFGNTTSFLP
jgi:hypothetical protein